MTFRARHAREAEAFHCGTRSRRPFGLETRVISTGLADMGATRLGAITEYRRHLYLLRLIDGRAWILLLRGTARFAFGDGGGRPTSARER
jgi:hypothetical protein